MSRILKIGMAQLNPVIGDIEGNVAKIVENIHAACARQIELVIFPEMTITGYIPQDLLFNRQFISDNLAGLDSVAPHVPAEMLVIVGFADRNAGNIYNAAALIQNGSVIGKRYKTLLPNYDVFDEKRYFISAESNSPVPVNLHGKSFVLGVEICEDLWDADSRIKITEQLAADGAELIVNLSASPFEYNKREVRRKLIHDKVKKIKTPFVLVNQVGGQDEFVFDGNSMMLDAAGQIIGWGQEFQETLTVVDIDLDTGLGKPVKVTDICREESIFNGLVTGVRDYFGKTGCSEAVLGLSGGIDSALVACIAVAALGNHYVTGVAMPGAYTAEESNADAKQLAENLEIKFLTLPIETIAAAYDRELQEIFQGLSTDITEENIQSRIRGNLLMALANKFGAYVLSTGNKTELALGYCTLYGDMAGALAVISDLSKLDVYAVARYVNNTNDRAIIPARIFRRAPSAELKANQVDPFDYNIVSLLVDEIIVHQKSFDELLASGYDQQLVTDIMNRIRLAEYKRRQAAPGLKVTGKAFGVGRRFPIINRYKK
ncbi:MAG TPA: NAD+ synthase [Candidatus Marinimicrobia bacterium]|nr:NAD+ synthase [Candidatus Neomarinimicrobiota bacterium]